MVCTVVHVYVKEESIEAFREASIENHKMSIQEEGNCRFDVLLSISVIPPFLS